MKGMLAGLLASALAVTTPARAGDIYVDNSPPGPFLGTSGDPYRRISVALFNAAPGDTIYIAEGSAAYDVTSNGETFPCRSSMASS